MKIVDKIIIVILGMLICTQISWDTPLPLIGLIPMIYVLAYSIVKAINNNEH